MDTDNPNTFGKIHSSPIFHHYHWCNSCEHYLEIPIIVHVDKTLFSQVAVSNIGIQSSEKIETLENVEKKFESSRDKTNKSSYISPCTVVHRTIHVHLF